MSRLIDLPPHAVFLKKEIKEEEEEVEFDDFLHEYLHKVQQEKEDTSGQHGDRKTERHASPTSTETEEDRKTERHTSPTRAETEEDWKTDVSPTSTETEDDSTMGTQEIEETDLQDQDDISPTTGQLLNGRLQ